MPKFKAQTKAKKGEQLRQALQGDLAIYEKVGLFTKAVTPRSAYRYRGVLLQYQKALQDNPPTPEASCQFLARLREDGFKPSTLRLYRAVLQGFHAWRGENLVFPVRIPSQLPQYHSAELVERMLGLAHEKPRDHLILRLMTDAGLRRGEVISLRVRDAELVRKMIRVRGKGGKARILPLTKELHELLEQYCHGKAPDDSVVGVKDKVVYGVVKKYAALAGEPDLHPHDLRHAFATRLVEGNANIRAVQELLGHTDLKTTAIYLGIVPKHLEQAIEILNKSSSNGTKPIPAIWMEQNKKTPQQSIGKTVGKREAADQQAMRQFFKEWRNEIQHMSLDQFIRISHLEDLAKHITLGLPESDNRAQPYRKTIAHQMKAIRFEKFQPSIEKDSLFAYIKDELYPNDNVWQAQDSWDTAYAAYFNAFDTWSTVTEKYAESLAEDLESEGTIGLLSGPVRGLVFAAIDCDTLELGIRERPQGPFWAIELYRISELRKSVVLLGMKTQSQHFWRTRENEIECFAKNTWDEDERIRDETTKLLEALSGLTTAEIELHEKLKTFERRLAKK